MHTKIKELLELALTNKASDVHIVSGVLPKLRVSGQLIDIGGFEDIDKNTGNEMILSMLTETQQEKIRNDKELDFSMDIGNARFRVNIYYQQGNLAAALRVIPSEIPDLRTLNLPEVLNQFVGMKQGFILITGPTGQGKSTTVASILNEINKNHKTHIVTVEDPIEYVIKPNKSIVSQRELGLDTNSFERALRSCLRQDPNVVFVGEMRDLETISSALTIAETGHLVFSTLHTNSAAQTIDRIIDVFPEGAKGQIRTQLASVLTAVVSQRLLPAKEGGLIPAFEILLTNGAVKNSIRENKTFMIDNIIQTSADVGMIGLETHLAKLVRSGKVDLETAMIYSLRPGELQSSLRGINK